MAISRVDEDKNAEDSPRVMLSTIAVVGLVMLVVAVAAAVTAMRMRM